MPVLEVDVQPLATGRACLGHGEIDETRPDAAPPSADQPAPRCQEIVRFRALTDGFRTDTGEETGTGAASSVGVAAGEEVECVREYGQDHFQRFDRAAGASGRVHDETLPDRPGDGTREHAEPSATFVAGASDRFD